MLESADDAGIKVILNLTPSSAMWPFGSKDSAPNRAPSSAGPGTPPAGINGPVSPELIKLKSDFYRAQNQVITLEGSVKRTVQQNVALTEKLCLEEQKNHALRDELSNVADALASSKREFAELQKRFVDVSTELEKIKPFAAVKTEQRRMTYTVSPELHKKWQSILRDTTRLQVLELLGQPTEILAVSHGGASPIQLVRKGLPAPRPELMQHVTNLVVGDGLLKDWVRGGGRAAWVYADDTLAPGVIFFASESDGGQVFRIFPPEC